MVSWILGEGSGRGFNVLVGVTDSDEEGDVEVYASVIPGDDSLGDIHPEGS